MKNDYLQVFDGDMIEIKLKKIVAIECCQCGLIHKFYFEKMTPRKLYVVISRDNRATAQRRRWKIKQEVTP